MSRRRPVTLRHLAEAAGVSLATASRAVAGDALVAEDTRRMVMETAARIGYAPLATRAGAGAGATRRHGALAVLLPGADVADPYFLRVVVGAQREAAAGGRRVIIAGQAGGMDARALRRLQVDGVLLDDEEDLALRERVAAVLPTVLVMSPRQELALDAVGWDDADAVRLAAGHLAAAGHRRIRFFDIHDHLAAGGRGNLHHIRRAEAFAALMPGLPGATSEVLPGRDQELDALCLARLRAWLAGPEPPTAVLCAADCYAIAFHHAARDCGLALPRDLSLVGIDDVAGCTALRPQLTSVRQPLEAIGAEAVRLLLRRLDAPDAPAGQRWLGLEVVARDSVAPPRR